MVSDQELALPACSSQPMIRTQEGSATWSRAACRRAEIDRPTLATTAGFATCALLAPTNALSCLTSHWGGGGRLRGLQAVHVLRERLALRLAARQLHAQLPDVRRQLLDPRLQTLQLRLRVAAPALSSGSFPRTELLRSWRPLLSYAGCGTQASPPGPRHCLRRRGGGHMDKRQSDAGVRWDRTP